MSEPRAPLVDAHFHTWQVDLPLADGAWHTSLTDAPIEKFVRTLDQHGVIFAVVAAASLHGEYNDHVRAALKAHRRLRATAILSPTTSIYQMEQMKADGFVGVRLMRSLSDKVADVNSGDYRMYLRRCADLNWHVHLVDKPERTAEGIAAVEMSGARLVIDHMGDLQTTEGVNNVGF